MGHWMDESQDGRTNEQKNKWHSNLLGFNEKNNEINTCLNFWGVQEPPNQSFALRSMFFSLSLPSSFQNNQ